MVTENIQTPSVLFWLVYEACFYNYSAAVCVWAQYTRLNTDRLTAALSPLVVCFGHMLEAVNQYINGDQVFTAAVAICVQNHSGLFFLHELTKVLSTLNGK